MSFISRILGALALSRTAAATSSLFMSLLLDMAALTIVAIVAGVLVAMLLMGGLWFSYGQFVAHGLNPVNAQLLLGGLLLFFLIIAISVARGYIKRAKAVSETLIHALQMPLMGQIPRITEAFMTGLIRKK